MTNMQPEGTPAQDEVAARLAEQAERDDQDQDENVTRITGDQVKDAKVEKGKGK